MTTRDRTLIAVASSLVLITGCARSVAGRLVADAIVKAHLGPGHCAPVTMTVDGPPCQGGGNAER